MIDNQSEGIRKRFGKKVPGETADATSLVKGSMVELNEEGTEKEGGITVESTIVSPQHFKNDEEKALFVGKNVGDEVVFNPAKTCTNNIVDLSSLLNLPKEPANVESNFQMPIQ